MVYVSRLAILTRGFSLPWLKNGAGAVNTDKKNTALWPMRDYF